MGNDVPSPRTGVLVSNQLISPTSGDLMSKKENQKIAEMVSNQLISPTSGDTIQQS